MAREDFKRFHEHKLPYSGSTGYFSPQKAAELYPFTGAYIATWIGYLEPIIKALRWHRSYLFTRDGLTHYLTKEPMSNENTSASKSVTLPSAISTPSGNATISQGHPKFDAVMEVLETLIPFAAAGSEPFLKNPGTQNIVVAETPLAQALFAALSKL